MFRKAMLLVFSALLVFNLCGCVALVAGAAGGAGTAIWLSGKLTEQLDASFEKSVDAAERALKSMKLTVTSKVVKNDVAQIRSAYSDGRKIWIDIHRLSSASSRIEIRVSAKGSKEASQEILDRVQKYL